MMPNQNPKFSGKKDSVEDKTWVGCTAKTNLIESTQGMYQKLYLPPKKMSVKY